MNSPKATKDNQEIHKKMGCKHNLRCAAKLNVAFGFVPKNIGDGSCRCYYAFKYNTQLERSKLVTTTEDLTKMKNPPSKSNEVDWCTRTRAKTKWKFYKLKNVKIFAALLKENLIGCKDTVLSVPLLKNQSVECFTNEEYPKAVQWYFTSFLRFGVAFAWKKEPGGGNYQITQSIPQKNWCNWSCKLPRCLYGRCCSSGRYCSSRFFLVQNGFRRRICGGELARRSVVKNSNTVWLLRHRSHICYVSNVNAPFKAFRCPSCDQFIKTAQHLERRLTTCKKRVKTCFSRECVSSERNTLFEKVDYFDTPNTDCQKRFKNMVIFDLETICVQKDKFSDTETTTWICKHVPISVSISSDLSEQPKVLCSSNPRAFGESFVDDLNGLATQSKAQKKIKLLENETSVKGKLNQVFSPLNQRRCRKEPVFGFEDGYIEEKEEQDVSTEFSQTQKNVTHFFEGSLGKKVQRSSNLWLQKRKIRFRLKKETLAASPC